MGGASSLGQRLVANLSVSVHGSNMNIGGIIFPLEQQSRDEALVVYHAQYDTEGVPHTKSGDRQPVQVSIEVGRHIYANIWLSEKSLLSVQECYCYNIQTEIKS